MDWLCSLFTIAIVISSVEGKAAKATFYISRTGDDSNSGSSSTPFRTLSRCVEAAPAGGRCIFQGGGRFEVEETVQLPRDITLEGQENSTTKPILDGSSELKTTWTKKSTSSCIYTSASISGPVTQLWANGTFLPMSTAIDVSYSPTKITTEGLKAPPTSSPSFELDGFAPLTPARFPNAKLSSDDAFNGAPSSYSGKSRF